MPGLDGPALRRMDRKTELADLRRRLAADGYKLLPVPDGYEIQHVRYDSIRSNRLTLEQVRQFVR